MFLLFLTFSGNRILAQTTVPGTDLSVELGNRYFDAVDYLRRNTWMSDTLKKERIQPAFAYGIIFPGLVKYSAIKDVMETGATRMLYVQSGRKYSHYEVGRFQMKPSFAELIERNVTRQKMTSQKFDLKNTSKARGERARRLDSQEWQLRYLVMFIRLMDKRFAHIKWKSEDDKLRFYATAFSVGFNRDERAIRRMMTTRSVLRRTSDAKSKYRSGDVAQWFYINDGYRFMAEF
ncbi:MAG: hypothetical protein IPF68_01140 [Bacteroidales bacterium]|nr:hypothetical protein [Bacteroidales bacterium]